MKRYTKLYLTLLQVRFQGFEQVSMEISHDFKAERIAEIEKILDDEDIDFSEIAKFSRIKRAEEMYITMLSKPSNPLAKVITVGCLRAVLKLATVDKVNKESEKCFNANMEFENNYKWADSIFENAEKYTTLYRTHLFPHKKYAVTNFLYKTLKLDQ